MNFDDLLNDAAGSELAKVDSNALPSNVAGEMTKASYGNKSTINL